jgi:hypothetical protein
MPWNRQRDAKSAVLPAIVIEADYKLIQSNGRIKNESCAKLGTIARESPSGAKNIRSLRKWNVGRNLAFVVLKLLPKLRSQ